MAPVGNADELRVGSAAEHGWAKDRAGTLESVAGPILFWAEAMMRSRGKRKTVGGMARGAGVSGGAVGEATELPAGETGESAPEAAGAAAPDAAEGDAKAETGSNRMRDWTPRRRQRFFDALRACCDAVEACRAVRMTTRSLYRLIEDDRAFADDWRRAVDGLYALVELRLLKMALVPVAPAGQSAQRELAQKLLVLHDARKKLQASGRWAQPKVKRATQAETDAAILKHLAALDRRIKMEEEEAEAEEAARQAEAAATEEEVLPESEMQQPSAGQKHNDATPSVRSI